jgi:hypothetical protein
VITAEKWRALDLALRRGKQTMRHTAYEQRMERTAEPPEPPDPQALAAWLAALERDDKTDPYEERQYAQA